jgi:anti-anti-sigma regulatory factor
MCLQTHDLSHGTDFATAKWRLERSKLMLSIHTDRIGDVAVLQCEGRIVRSDSAFKLRDEVTAHTDVRVIVLDLSEVTSIEGGGLGMLLFLERWALDNDIHLKVFNPSNSVRHRLEQAQSVMDFEISTVQDVSSVLAHAEGNLQHTHF